MDWFQYFAKDYHGAPFILFGTVHIVTLILVALFVWGMTFFKGAPEVTLVKVRWTLAIVLWLNETAWHAWNIAVGTWTVQSMLPLQLCNVLVWMTGFTLITKNQSLYEFSYFLGIGAASQSLFTSDAGIYGFPHFRYVQTIISHGVLVTAAIYLTVVEGLRPRWKSIVHVFVITNLYMIFLYFLNLMLGSNYMMVNHKPDVPSLFSLMPDWPGYILWSEVLAVIIILLLYLPFVLGNWMAKEERRIS